MRITFFGSSIVSAYWNGAATYYRGICRRPLPAGPPACLRRAGHLRHGSSTETWWKTPSTPKSWCATILADLDRELERARGSDLVVKCSGVGRYDDYLDRAVLSATNREQPRRLSGTWTRPFTLERADP